jgi:hypothetical protein
MTIFVFGNPDLPADSLPIRILPRLRKGFPTIDFRVVDPNEELEPAAQITVIDTVEGINDVRLFDGLESFVSAPRGGVHDFDALAGLKMLQKLGQIRKISVIGIPSGMGEKEALIRVSTILRASRS